jgi:hypothetical protein
VRWATPVIRAGGQADATDDSGDSGVRKPNWRMPGPVLQGLIAFVIYVVVFILAFGQALLPHLNDPRVGQVEVDPNFYIWAWRWWPYAVSHLLNPLYSHQIGAPGGYNLAWATTSPTVSLLMWPVTAIIGPIAAFNLTLLLAPPASAWAAFIVARRLTGKFWAALPAGVVYGFNVYELAHEVSGQPNLTVTVLLPLMVYLVLLWWDGTLKRNGFIIWTAVAIALEFYTFVEAFAEMTVVWVAALLIGFVVAGRDTRLKVAWLALYSAVAYVAALVLAAPYLYFALKNYPDTLTRPQPANSLDLSSLVLPRTDRLLGMKWWAAAAGHDLKAVSYVGIPLLVLFLLLAVTTWSSRVTRLLAVGFVITIAFAVGPTIYVDGQQLVTLPWSGMWNLPIAKSAEPSRFIVFGYLILGVGLSLWLARLTRSWLLRAARWGLGLLAIAAIFADLPTFAEVVVPPPAYHWQPAIPSDKMTDEIPTFFTQGLYKHYLKPGETVVILSHRGNAGMLFQAYTGFYFNIAGGFINASLSRPDALPIQVALLSYPTRARANAFRAYIKSDKIGALIVERAWSEHWMYVFTKIGLKTTTVGGVTIFTTPY